MAKISRILCDLDGCILNLVDSISDAKTFATGIRQNRHYEIHTWNSPMMEDVWDYLRNPDIYKLWGQPYSGARLVLETLRRDYEVIIATHRPPETLDLVNWWMKNTLHIEPLPVLFGGEKWRFGGDVLIDDKPENCEEYALHTGPAILVRRMDNEQYILENTPYPILKVTNPRDTEVIALLDATKRLYSIF